MSVSDWVINLSLTCISKEEPVASTSTSTSSDRGRGRGLDRGRGRGRGRGATGEGRGAAPRPPAVEMTASGPFAMGPALVGMSGRRTAPRSNFAPIVPQPPGADGKPKLGAGLTQTTAPSLKKEKEGDEEVYSDPDDGVEIVDMENVRQMDWMAPESLRKERDTGKKKGTKVKKEDRVKLEDAQRKGTLRLHWSCRQEHRVEYMRPATTEVMDVDRSASPDQEVNVANAVDLSESEEEEELEDIIDDFAQTQEQQEVHCPSWFSYINGERSLPLYVHRIRTSDKNVYTFSNSHTHFPHSSHGMDRLTQT